MKPMLVKNEDGKICIQVVLGSHCATLPLPEVAATWDKDRIQLFMDNVVPEMINGLRRKRREEIKKVARKQ